MRWLTCAGSRKCFGIDIEWKALDGGRCHFIFITWQIAPGYCTKTKECSEHGSAPLDSKPTLLHSRVLYIPFLLGQFFGSNLL